MKKELTADRLREVLHYDQTTGFFSWRISSSNRAPSGSKAGGLDGKGYLRIKVDGQEYRAHRLVWLWVFGAWPECLIDHINHEKTDNRLCNLREATASQNQQNRRTSRNNTSGYTGVYWDRCAGKWGANIHHLGTQKNLGRYQSKEEARQAYVAAASEMHTHNQAVHTIEGAKP